ncbi:MAG: histidine phosphatase family protein [Pseudomonadota bacterium]|nr:histidine phosphatase family protein [Pseudomonadota bacterium]
MRAPFARMDATLTASLHAGRLLLIRHGQTSWNVERRFLGRTDIPLDAVGIEQAARLGRRLAGTPLAALWTSPLARARQTAAALGEAQAEEGLVEMDMGDLEGLAGREFAERYPDLVVAWRDEPAAVRLPGGEVLADVQARGVGALARIAATVRPGETVAVVTHQLVLATVVCHHSGAPLAAFRTFMHRNTGITTLELGPAPRIVTFDDAAHLAG